MRSLFKMKFLFIFFIGLIQAQAGLFINQGQPTETLKELFQLLEYRGKNEIEAMNEWSQENLRRQGGERWNPKKTEHVLKLEKKLKAELKVLKTKDMNFFFKFINELITFFRKKEPEYFIKLYQFFKKVNWIDEILPQVSKYNRVLIYGAAIERMEKRMSYFKKLVSDKKLDLKELEQPVVLLCGERKIDPNEKPSEPGWSKWGKKILEKKIPLQEPEVMKFIWDEVGKQMKSGWGELKPKIIYAQKKEGQSRAHTEDTVQSWLQTTRQSSLKGEIKVLLISNNPYIRYQEQVMLNRYHQVKNTYKNFKFEAVGSGVGHFEGLKDQKIAEFMIENVAVYLDTVARLLFEEKKYRMITQ